VRVTGVSRGKVPPLQYRRGEEVQLHLSHLLAELRRRIASVPSRRSTSVLSQAEFDSASPDHAPRLKSHEKSQNEEVLHLRYTVWPSYKAQHSDSFISEHTKYVEVE
jgi:hypothetical protein